VSSNVRNRLKFGNLSIQKRKKMNTKNFSIVALKLSQQRAECYSVLGVALLALAFICIFGGMLHSICFISRICITVVGLVRSSFLCTKVAISACALTCGRSLTVRSVQDVLISFRVF